MVEVMITKRVSLGTRKEYSNFSGRGFNFNWGGASKDGTIGIG